MAGKQAIITPIHPPAAAKAAHVRSRGGGHQNKLSLVAKLQNEETQKRCPERPQPPFFQQVDRPAPRPHAEAGKNQRQGVEKLQGVFADPPMGRSAGDDGDQAIAKRGQDPGPRESATARPNRMARAAQRICGRSPNSASAKAKSEVRNASTASAARSARQGGARHWP